MTKTAIQLSSKKLSSMTPEIFGKGYQYNRILATPTTAIEEGRITGGPDNDNYIQVSIMNSSISIWVPDNSAEDSKPENEILTTKQRTGLAERINTLLKKSGRINTHNYEIKREASADERRLQTRISFGLKADNKDRNFVIDDAVLIEGTFKAFKETGIFPSP